MSAPSMSPTPRRLDWPHVALVALAVLGGLGALAIVLALTPPPLLDKMLELNWPAVILGIVSMVIAVIGMLRRAGLWKPTPALVDVPRPALDPVEDDGLDEPTPAMGPNAMRRRDRPPGTSSVPPRREGSVRPPTLIGVALIAGILSLCALLASGCGASPTRVHASIATVSIDTARVARQLLLESMERRIADCAERELAVRAVCLDSAEATDRALGATLDAALLAIDVYRGEVAASHARGDDPETASAALGRAQAYAAAHWQTFLELGRASGVPVDVLTGGES